MSSYLGKRVKDVMTPREKLVTLSPSSTIRDAAMKMIEKKVGSILVTDGDKLLGIFTERDVVRCVSENTSMDEKLDKVMTRDLIVIGIDKPLSKAAYLMSENNIRHLPVVDEENKLMGILSSRDVARFYAEVIESAEYRE